MASTSSKRSQLIDYTYSEVCSLVSGRREGTRPEQIIKILEARVERLQNISEPFRKPSDASKKRIESGSVTLPDGVEVDVEDVYKPVIYAVSEHLQIDQVDALVLLRSFLYNEHYPDMFNSEDAYSSVIDEILDKIRPFYYSERLNVVRTLVALIKCQQEVDDPLSSGAQELLSKIIKNPTAFTMNIISEFLRRTRLPIPDSAASDPRAASAWAKQNAKEQLVLMEALFWMLWAEVQYTAPMIVEVFVTAYETEFGYAQENSAFMLDEEGQQIQRDIAALWVLITIEVVELETVAQNINSFPAEYSDDLLHASPLSLLRIHKLVMAHPSPGYVCTTLAWALYLRALSDLASHTADRPDYIVPFLQEIRSSAVVSHKKGEKELHATLVDACLRPESGLFAFITTLLSESPVFVATVASKTGSAVSNPNEVAYRALIKGLLMALVDARHVELIPDFDGLVETWIALFGSNESGNNAGLRRQFWDVDWNLGPLRRAIFDVARTRFPIQFRPIVRLLRAMSGGLGVEGTDPILSSEHDDLAKDEAHRMCSSYAFVYFQDLPTYTQVIPASERAGVNSLYDRVLERSGPGSSAVGGGVAYTNLRPINLPGGTVLPAKSIGRLLCADSSTEPVVVAWRHQHSGWNVVMEVLIDYVSRRQSYRSMNRHAEVAHGRDVPVVLQLDDIGIERDSEEALVTDALELILSIVQGNYIQTLELWDTLIDGPRPTSYAVKNEAPPGLVQLMFMILEDALTRSTRVRVPSSLVTAALGILSALLSTPNSSHGIWLYLRRSSVLFGSDRDANFTSAILAAERASGHYAMTLMLLRLVRTLFEEAIASLIETQRDVPEVAPMKEEVLLRAMRFVHGQIWMEHSGWRYAHLGNRFEIGRSVAALYSRVIETSSAVASAHTFASLSRFVADIMIHQATTSSIMPLVHTIASGRSIFETLESRRRFHEASQYIGLLKDSLRLVRLVLHLKASSEAASKLTLLEQALCSDHSSGNILLRSRSERVNTVDMMSHYVKQRELGPQIPLEAIRALTALMKSVSGCTPTPPSLIGCFSDAQATMNSFVRIMRHPYDDLALRNAIWTFVCVAVECQPALAVLFVTGQFRVDVSKGKEKLIHEDGILKKDVGSSVKTASAVQVACEMLSGWKKLWEANPQLLASVLSFLDVVWTRSLDHLATLAPSKGDAGFWSNISAIINEELGPPPDYTASKTIDSEDGMHSDLHDAVSSHAYRVKVKAHALRIVGSDVAIQARSGKTDKMPPASFKDVRQLFQAEDSLTDAVSDAISTSYDPNLYDDLTSILRSSFAPLSTQSLQSPEPLDEREFGDGFMLSVPLLRNVLQSAPSKLQGQAEKLQSLLYSVNLNMSLAYPQLNLVDAWCFFLQQIRGYLQGDARIRTVLLTSAASIARDLAMEKRSGDFMSNVHGSRLRLLVALLEAAWFAPGENKEQIISLMSLLDSVSNIILSEQFPPEKSFLGITSNPFHRSLLQFVYFCANDCQRFASSQYIKAEHRLLMGRTFTIAVTLVADALRLTFDTARTRLDLDLDKDMELLVAVFQQCTRPGLHTSAQVWLTKCQESDVIRASLELLAQTDIAGLMDLNLLRSNGRPLYAPHVLTFHMALASLHLTAERLASENIIPAYCNNSISVALSEGSVDVSLPELPGERSPAHKAYCSMLANVAGIISNLVSPRQFIESQVVGFVQLYGAQLSKALSWNNDLSITVPLVEELELTVELFHVMATGAASSLSPSLTPVLRTFSEHALQLVQQFNYALTHPKHLTSLLEPVASEERLRLDRESSDSSVSSLTELTDAGKRPMMAGIVRRLFSITTSVLSTLVILGGAETVLLSDPEEWPIKEAMLVPHSKVTMGEAASVGTLLELGNCSLDMLSFLANKKPSPVPATTSSLSTGQIHTCRQLLETLLLYASTQLAMWVAKQDGEQPGEMEVDEIQQHADNSGYGYRTDATAAPTKERDRRIRRKSLSLADRLRRGMTGEMTTDLEGLVAKAKPVIAKSSDLLGKPDPIDILPIVAKFLEERVVAS